ncbi:gas vesicle structural protein GvpA [Nocardiopsis sp. DSM 44743]|uniref:Gas vesicle protein A n=2 Tax=Nocardiopsis lambiniae TaxID=3075539 RepID=A0ABU2M8L0_9ACTN|nr:gas vesicle structural protein GvpA [Nocardiopsis sp. DSM 44743]MDT0328311.1 gas vesicle structural protein GvpA [Nocardiopsis sp. DSM 44743]
MTVMQQAGNSARPGGLYDVLDLILDKGLVIDVFVRVSLVGIELITIDIRIVVASVDTYLRFAEACNRLDLSSSGGVGLPDLVGGTVEKGAEGKTKGALRGVTEAVTEPFKSDDSEESDKEESEKKERTSTRSRRRSSTKESE